MAKMIPETALDDRLAFVGTAGSGKTYAAGTAVERLLTAGSRVVVLDPLDVWFGLRLNSDGKSEAFPVVIFGGAHGDLALTENAGALIGETVAGMAESCIVSLAALGTKASERRFVLAFLTALYRHTKGEPVHLVFDEADMWAPQRLMDRDGDAARLSGQMETIVRRGRVKGFIPWLITQRPAVLSKDILSQADGLIAMKLTASQDRDALGAWIEGQADKTEEKRILARLPQLDRGSGVIWIPGRGILTEAAFPAKQTFDSSRTPKRGEKKRGATLRPIDISGLRGRLASVEDEIKANDPKALRSELAALKRQFSNGVMQSPVIDPAEREKIERAGYDRGYVDGRRHGRDDIANAAAEHLTKVGAELNRLASADLLAAEPPFVTPTVSVTRQRETVAAPAREGAGVPMGAERRILAVLASVHPASMTEAQWAVAAGMKRSGGTWSTYKSRLRSAARVEPAGSGWRVTERGMTDVGADIEPMPAPGMALVEYWAERIPGAAPMLRVLAKAFPRDMGREELAAILDMTASGGTFSTYLSRLRSPGLIEVGRGGSVRASADLMRRP